MNITEIKDYISKHHGVNPDYLKHVVFEPISNNKELEWVARLICKPKECFGNSFQLVCMEHDLKVVLGYGFMHDAEIVYEHAWLQDEKTEKFYDPTLDVVINQSGIYKDDFFVLHTFTFDEYMKKVVENEKGYIPIHHLTLRCDVEFSHLWIK